MYRCWVAVRNYGDLGSSDNLDKLGKVVFVEDDGVGVHIDNSSIVSSIAVNGYELRERVFVASTGNIVSLSGFLTIDGELLSDGKRVLVKDQLDKRENGIYIVRVGVLNRRVPVIISKSTDL